MRGVTAQPKLMTLMQGLLANYSVVPVKTSICLTSMCSLYRAWIIAISMEWDMQ